MHKEYEHIPPERPIVSGSGSITENIGKFVAHHLKDVSNKHDTYLEETPDFIRKVEECNKKGLPANAIIVTFDVSGLFTNIPIEDGLESVEECLNERQNKEIPTGYLLRMLEIILQNNIFEFHEEKYTQNIGTGMGQPPTPPYADCFMAKKVDAKLKYIANKYSEVN